jgi:serine/threonine protein kinase
MLLVGKTIKNRYRVDESLGRGGMSEVYKVWDEKRQKFLAMKILREDLAHDIVFLKRFDREANTLAKLQHPNIVRFYGLEHEEMMTAILMDYIEGESLREVIFRARDTGLQDGHILSILEPTCSALNYAHQEGIVHCDLKPGNILIDKNGTVFVSDFGIARHMDATTVTMVGIGTPAYMAPELIRGDDPTPQTDIYALGVILYELFCKGNRPFTGERAEITGTQSAKIWWEHLNIVPSDIALMNPEALSGLNSIVQKCLEKDPVARYSSTTEVYQALVDVFGGERSVSELKSFFIKDKKLKKLNNQSDEEEPNFQTEKIKRKSLNKIKKLDLVTGIILLGLISLLMTRPVDLSAEKTALAIEKTKIVQTESSLQIAATQIAIEQMKGQSSKDTKKLEIDQKEIITSENLDKLMDEVIYSDESNSPLLVRFSRFGDHLLGIVDDNKVILYDLIQRKIQNTIENESPIDNIEFFDQYPYLVVSTDDHKLVIWDYVNKTKLNEMSAAISWTGKASVTDVAVSPNGHFIANSANDTLRLWSLNSDLLLDKLDGNANYFTSVTFSPDSKMLASGSRDNGIRLWNVEYGKLNVVDSFRGQSEPINDLKFSPDGKLLISSDDLIRFYDIDKGEMINSTKGWGKLAISPDGKLLLNSGWDGFLIRNGEDGTVIKSMDFPNYSKKYSYGSHAGGLDFSSDGKFICFVFADYSVLLLSISE